MRIGGAFLKEDGFDFTKSRRAFVVEAPACAGMTRLAAAERRRDSFWVFGA
jgi:hypothetical protein